MYTRKLVTSKLVGLWEFSSQHVLSKTYIFSDWTTFWPESAIQIGFGFKPKFCLKNTKLPKKNVFQCISIIQKNQIKFRKKCHEMLENLFYGVDNFNDPCGNTQPSGVSVDILSALVSQLSKRRRRIEPKRNVWYRISLRLPSLHDHFKLYLGSDLRHFSSSAACDS